MSDRAEPTAARTAEPIAPHVVTFTTQWGSYYAGESAAFSEMDAAALVEEGVATAGGTSGEPTGPPTPDTPRGGGVMVAGLEFPPRRRFPADPQNLNIPQTYDPTVRRQLERAERDRAAGKPGMAAQEDLERAIASRPADVRDRREPPPPPRTDPA
jgi:hypothetical protein